MMEKQFQVNHINQYFNLKIKSKYVLFFLAIQKLRLIYFKVMHLLLNFFQHLDNQPFQP